MENLSVQAARDLNPAAQNEEAASRETDTERAAENFRERIAGLQIKLKDAEETIRRQQAEIKNLTANVDVLVGQIRKLTQRAEPADSEEKISAPPEVERFGENSDSTIADLESQITKIKENLRHKEATIEALEKSFSAKTSDFESQLSNKDKLLLERDKRVRELEFELGTVIKRMKELSSSLRQTGALTAFQQDTRTAPASPSNGNVRSLSTAGTNGSKNPPVAPDRGVVPSTLFNDMARELTAILGPLAPALIHYDVVALSESMESFPRKRLAQLLDTLTREIADETVARNFRERFIKS
ncbi:MAG TPA: hypothetical protein VLX11_12565 [Candidatus Acidoferrales bacterium]|nr:hypothetical protein [Candidatus Acidoferrales bacterium]